MIILDILLANSVTITCKYIYDINFHKVYIPQN